MSKSKQPLRCEALESRDTPSAGMLDATFHGTGTFTAPFAGSGPDQVRVVTVQPDGKIVAAGSAHGATDEFAVARYNADGTVDPTFGTNGQVITDFGANAAANGLSLQADGKIVVVGHADGGLNGDFAIARYNSDGTLDATFGTNGKVITDSGSDSSNPWIDSAENVHVNDDGTILVQGTRINANILAPTVGDRATVMVQYNADGTLDTTFGTNGIQVIHPVQDLEFAGSFSSVVPLAGGKTLVVGSTDGTSGTPSDFLVKRYNADGTLDTSFGTNGRVAVNIGEQLTPPAPGLPALGSSDNAYRAAIQPDGKIVIVGSTDDGSGKQFAVVRLNTDGMLDDSFGDGGKVVTDIPHGEEVALNAVIQANGKIMVLGTSGSGGDARLAVARYDGTGAKHNLVVSEDHGPPIVNVFDPTTGALKFQITAFSHDFKGGVRVATGDVNGDGVDDIIVAAGPGGGPHVKVFDGKTGALLSSFFAYDPNFTGGVYVAAADVNGDGRAEIITGAGRTGGPHVRVFDGLSGIEVEPGFFAYDPNFTGGVRVAAGDVYGNGKTEIITSAGPGGGPHIRIYSATPDAWTAVLDTQPVLPDNLNGHVLLGEFMAFALNFSGGTYVAAGDLDGNGAAEIIVSQGNASASSHVRIFNGGDFSLRADLVPFTSLMVGRSPLQPLDDLRVAAVDRDGDGLSDIVVSAGPHRGPQLVTFKGTTLATISIFSAFDPSVTGGTFVA